MSLSLWMIGAAYLTWVFCVQVDEPEPTVMEILGAALICPLVIVAGLWSLADEFGLPSHLYPGVWAVWIPFLRVMVGLLSSIMAAWRMAEVWSAWRARS